jgi:hypothetical protein
MHKFGFLLASRPIVFLSKGLCHGCKDHGQNIWLYSRLVKYPLSFMPQFFEALWLRPDFWWLLAIPLVAAFLGGVGNWLSWRLLFGPAPLWGKYRQGILAAHTAVVADRLGHELARLFRLSDLFRLMEPEKVAAHASDTVLDHLDDYVDAVMTEKYAVLWDNLPVVLRRGVYGRVRRQLPFMLDNLMDDMAENIDELVDIPALVLELLGGEPDLAKRLLADALETERRFSCRAGALTGFLLGLPTLLLWWHQPRFWLLPIGMAIIAIAAQWLPRKLLFWPASPLKVGPFTWRGYSLRQQTGFLSVFATNLARDLFTLRRFMQALLAESRIRRTRSMIRRHMRPLLDAGMIRTSLQLVIGAEGYANIKQRVVDRAVMMTLGSFSAPDVAHASDGLVQDMCQRHLQAMSVQERSNLLLPILSEGWWLQFMVVAAVGFMSGVLLLVARFMTL